MTANVKSRPIRIGIVGAGRNTRDRHIPGFRSLAGVELAGVVNSTPESTARAAREFDILRQYPDWQALVADDGIDAVLIGTWPNLHADVACAALEAGRHVLTEARMARDLAEARRMFETARSHPELTAQIVPSPFGLVHHDQIVGLLNAGFLGELRELVVLGADDMFADRTQSLHWRQDRELSGLNVLAMGILHETVRRWTPPPVRVFAQTALFEPERPARTGTGTERASVPDSVQIVTQLAGGARGLYHLSGAVRFGPGRQIHLYGSRGTIKLDLNGDERLWTGRAGDRGLQPVELPPQERGGWRVEAEFIGAIRGEEPVRFTDFATGLDYMEFTEAVHRSAEQGSPVGLPLAYD